jgi:S-DNA-T family DNA segregation ATPase FtsK/SpoIIIE
MQEHEQSQIDQNPTIEASIIINEASENPELDDIYPEAVRFVTESREVSVSAVQRKFKIGYNRSSTIIETMEAEGIVSCAEPHGRRFVLAPPPM